MKVVNIPSTNRVKRLRAEEYGNLALSFRGDATASNLRCAIAHLRFAFSTRPGMTARENTRSCFYVIASQRVRANARPMTGSAKQSIAPQARMDCFRLRSLSYGGQVVAGAPLHKRFAFVAGNDGHTKTKMAGKIPAISISSVVARYAWLATVLPSAACAAARRAIGTR